jgi:F-type H+-transporting ATPase subunit b
MTIDWWTLAIQTVNVVVLVWLLQRFFWRPIAAMIAQRRTATAADLAAAIAKETAATAALADIAATRAGFGKERDAILAKAHDEAEAARAAGSAAAAKDAAALTAAATAGIEKDRQAAGAAWSERAGQLAVEIAGRLAARLDGAAVRASFLEWLLAEIRALPEGTRSAAGELGAVSATALDAADQARYGAAIATAFGAQPHIVFSVDPALIAGIEVHGPHFTVGNSWRADLATVLAGIGHRDGR